MDKGASVPDQALAVPVEPVARLDPSGFDPSRVAALEKIVRDTLWMAQRYADGRMTYAVALYNDAAEVAMKLGVVPVSSDMFARDGMFATVADPDADTGCADDQIWADFEALRDALASGIETEGQDGETRLGAKHESPTRQGDAQVQPLEPKD